MPISTRTRPKSEDLTILFTDPKIDPTCKDQAAWAWLKGYDFPLTHYDEETWRQLAWEGEPSARMTSNFEATLGVIDDLNPEARISTNRSGNRTRAQISIDGPAGKIERVVESEDRSRPLASLLVEAFSAARDRALELERKIADLGFDIASVEHPAAWKDAKNGWSLEKCGDWFRCVHREMRLATSGFGKVEIMATNADLLRWDLSTALKMRDRFEDLVARGEIQLDGIEAENQPPPT